MLELFTALMPFSTERLEIRPLVKKDAVEVAELTNDPAITDVVHFLASPFTVADAMAMIAGNNATNCFLGIRSEDNLIGVVGTHAYDNDRLEIGYWIGSKFQRRGYASEAVSGIIAELQRVYPSCQITAECRVGNEGSWNLLHKLGFSSTGRKGNRPGRELLAIQSA